MFFVANAFYVLPVVTCVLRVFFFLNIFSHLFAGSRPIWGFPKPGGSPIAGWFIMEHPIQMNDDYLEVSENGGTPSSHPF